MKKLFGLWHPEEVRGRHGAVQYTTSLNPSVDSTEIRVFLSSERTVELLVQGVF